MKMDREAFEAALARVSQEPDSPEAHIEAGQMALDFGERQRAIGLFTRAYTLDPNRKEVLDKLKAICSDQEFQSLSKRLPARRRPFWADLLLSLVFPLHWRVVWLVFFVAAVLFGARVLFVAMAASPIPGLAFAFFAVSLGCWGFASFTLYRIIESTGLYGGTCVTLITDRWTDAIDFGLRSLAAFVVSYLPCALVAIIFPKAAIVAFILAALGTVYLPMQLLCLFLSDRILPALSPKLILQMIGVAPLRYAAVVVIVFAGGAAEYGFSRLVHAEGDNALLWIAPKQLLATFFLFALARALGVLYAHHRSGFAQIETPEAPREEGKSVETSPPMPEPVKEPEAPKTVDPSPELVSKYEGARIQAQQNSDDVDAQLMAGTLAIEAGKREEGIHFLARAFRLDPMKKYLYAKIRSVCTPEEFRALHLVPPPGDYKKEVWSAFSFPFKGGATVFVPGVAFFSATFFFAKLVMLLMLPFLWVLLACYSLVMLFEIVRISAQGDEERAVWTEFDMFTIAGGFGKFAAVLLFSALPALAAAYFLPGNPYLVSALGLIGLLYFPMAILAACFYSSLVASFWPLFVLRSIAAVWWRYLLFCGIAIGCLVLMTGGTALALALGARLDADSAFGFLAVLLLTVFNRAVWLYFAIVIFRALGLLYRHGRDGLAWDVR